MSKTINALDFLANDVPPAPVYVLFGSDRFLKRLSLERIRRVVFGDDEDAVSLAAFEGTSVQWRDVVDELDTVSLFGGNRRMVVLGDAENLISEHRSQLEAYVATPSRTSILVLDTASWPSNTRLFKAVAEKGLAIECGPPQRPVGTRSVVDEKRILQWLRKRSADVHRATLTPQAAQQLVEIAGHDMGLLDQHLAKLAVLIDPGDKVTPELVTEAVGGWRTKSSWDMLESAADGNAADALRQLDRLLQSGEAPQALFGAISWSLRRFADATRIIESNERKGARVDLRGALMQAGFRKWPQSALVAAERQLRQIGRARAGRLHRWLLQTDLALKSTHSVPHRARLVLETLIVRIAKHGK